MTPPRRAVLLANTKSRRGRDGFEQSVDILKKGGIELTSAEAFQNHRDLSAAVAARLREGAPLVIVGGGDGTFSSVAHLFAGKDATLGVLPLGTGNAFARDLGIPPDLEKACETIIDGSIAQVDMGLVADRQFVNVATVGLSTLIALGLEDELKKKLGKGAYVFSLFSAFAKVKPFKAELDLPGERQEFDCLQLVVGNGRFHAGPFPVTPDASIAGGYLSVYGLASRRKSALLKMSLRMYGGRHVDLSEVKSFRVQSGRLSATPAQRITVDGETCLATPVSFGIAPGALRVAVPTDFKESQADASPGTGPGAG